MCGNLFYCCFISHMNMILLRLTPISVCLFIYLFICACAYVRKVRLSLVVFDPMDICVFRLIAVATLQKGSQV